MPSRPGRGPWAARCGARAPVRLHGDVKAVNYYADGTRPGALLAVPLVERRGGHVRGVVVVDRLEPNPFTEADERLLVTLAATRSCAPCDAERLMKDVRQTRAENERFYRAIGRLNRTRSRSRSTTSWSGSRAEMVAVDFAAVALARRGESGASGWCACVGGRGGAGPRGSTATSSRWTRGWSVGHPHGHRPAARRGRPRPDADLRPRRGCAASPP